MMPMTNLPHDCVITSEVSYPWLDYYESFVANLFELLKVSGWELGIRFVSLSEMRLLNRDFRGKDEPTDVLSFGDDLVLQQKSPVLKGDLAICVERVFEQAQDFEVTPEEELKRVTLHGLLHLQGWDHETNSPDEPMLKLQEELLPRLREVVIL
ncbi:MAG: rRNA maturation RNase YbeY [Spirochaetales bacterium]|nr:rRNA maturation RNase YbeY [Spirochaetales bacterium]